MKSIRSLLVVAGLSVALAPFSFAAESDAGYVDIGQLMPSAKGQFVEVNLSSAMLKFAAKIVAHQEPETAQLISGLKSVHVNVVGLDDGNRAANVDKIEAVRSKLEARGWTKVVTVREEQGGDNVNVHVKQHGEEAIDGLVVTVIGHDGQAVLVNIVGNIDLEQIARIADKLNIGPLRHLHLNMEPTAEKKHV